MLFKILVDGRSCHGGTLEWSLPTADGPGAWHEVQGPTQLCRRGLHLATDPRKWLKPGCRIYVVDAEGIGERADADCKIVVQRARLVRELTPEEYEWCRVLTRGVHVVTDGEWIAYGSATVRAYGSATVDAYDSATVRAYGSATVRAYGSATATSWSGAPRVSLSGYAVWVDRTSGRPVVHVAAQEGA